MAEAIFQGSTDLLEQPKRRTWSMEAGWATVRTWVGPKEATEAWAFKLSTTAGVSQVESSDDGAVGTVSATYPDPQTPGTNPSLNVTWELIGNSLEKPLETHSSIQSSDATIRGQLAKAKKYAMNPDEDLTPDQIAAKIAAFDDKVKNWYALYSQGVTGYEVTYYVLRKTIKVASGDQVRASLSNGNKVEAPTGVPTDLFDIPVDYGDSATDYTWLKRPPTVTYLGRGKYSIQQEWWGAKWSQILYGGTKTP